MKNLHEECPFSQTKSRPHASETISCPLSGNVTPADFDPFDAPYQLDPALALKWSREQLPVFYSESMGYWIISRYEDIKTVFKDPVLFSPRNVLERITPATTEATQILQGYGYQMGRTLVNEDEPMHMQRRRALMDHFLPKNLVDKAQLIRKLTSQKIDAFIDKGHVELVDGLLYEVPLLVALYFLGVPEDDVEKLKAFSVAHSINTWGKPTKDQQNSIAHEVGQFWHYAGEVIKKMRAQPNGEGWMHHTIRQNAKYPDIVSDSYVHSMMMAIIVAAHETTSLASANMFRTLLSKPDVWKQICQDPSLIPNAVEECLRYSGSIVAWRRQTTAATTLAGVSLPKDAKLLIVQASGNRDERHFENADDFDLYRDNTTDHLTFGYGAHQCLGKNIARMEMRIFLEEITRRLPHLQLSDQEFSYVPSISFRGPEQVWVHWDPQKNPEIMDSSIKTKSTTFAIGSPKTQDIARQAVVRSVANIAEDIIKVTLSAGDGNKLPKWSAGSHIELIHGDYSRKYSLCGDGDSDDYHIAILKEEHGHGGSEYFHQTLTQGLPIKIRGPRNFFRLNDTASHYILIAGGIGITPIIAMADQLKRLGKSYHLHYAGRSRSRMAFLPRLKQDHQANLTLYIKDESRRIDLPLLLAKKIDDIQIYACGPQSMIEELKYLAQDLPTDTLHYESFSGIKAPLDPKVERSFKVQLVDSNIELTVSNTQTLLEAIEEAGIDLGSDCREGLCGSCEVEVYDGDIDHRDTVLSANERLANNRIITCCSRAKKGRILKLKL